MSKYRVITDQGAYEVTTDEPDSFGGMVKQAASDVFTKPAAMAKDLGTNPETMANSMPTALGTLGAVSPIPGGATMGTAGGQGIRDLALKGLNKPVPGIGQHVLELGGAALGDVAAIPGIKSNIAGKQIGKALSDAGLSEVEKIPPPSQVRTALVLAQKINAKGDLTPAEAVALKPAMDAIWKKGWFAQKAYTQYAPDVAKASGKIQTALNTIPGRAGPAADMASAMTIPNALSSIPRLVKSAPVWAQAAGGTAASILGLDALKHALGGSR